MVLPFAQLLQFPAFFTSSSALIYISQINSGSGSSLRSSVVDLRGLWFQITLFLHYSFIAHSLLSHESNEESCFSCLCAGYIKAVGIGKACIEGLLFALCIDVFSVDFSPRSDFVCSFPCRVFFGLESQQLFSKASYTLEVRHLYFFMLGLKP